MLTRREEYSTPFPDLPTLDEYVRNEKNARLKAAREQRERVEAEAEERDWKEYPENYVDVRQMIHDFVQRKGFEVLPPKKPVRAVCEHCNGVQLELLTSRMLRELADVVEKQEAEKPRERKVG